MNTIADTQASPTDIDDLLTRHFLLEHPREAAHTIERASGQSVAAALSEQPVYTLLTTFQFLTPNIAAEIIDNLPPPLAASLLAELSPHHAVTVIGQWQPEQQAAMLALLPPAVQHELRTLMDFPADTAGRLMDTRIIYYRPEMQVADVLASLRRSKLKTARALFLVDDEGRLNGKVHLQDIAVAEPDTLMETLAQPVTAAVQQLAHSDEVAELFDQHQLLDLPVIDIDQRLLGIIYHASLVKLSHEDLSSDVLAMVGASREERALSKPLFAVKKRMPWLQINLLTAFLAASVVGFFEQTIAQFTALAVLLPVVAGQSGNAGAQALAVTMRGLALREITTRQWAVVMFKEVRAGLMNGICIAVTCGLGVFVWSQSLGLVMVICSSMILAMIAAGFAGAVVPIVLVRLGQDPAQASSIILTTVTDITGFFAFLGIATLMASFL